MTVAVTPMRKADASIVGGEFPFTEQDFRKIASMLHADAGLSLPDSKATLVYSRLAKRLRTLGLESFRQYCELVSESAGAGERRNMLAALTTNVTRFFREPHHFDHLKSAVLTPALQHVKKGGRVRIWSAACSTGQEPYSMALTILSLLPDAPDHDIKVLATDIDPNVVATARRGVYSQSEVSPIPADLARRWMEPADGGMAAGDAMRRLVTFRELNLIGRWPMTGRFDAIFCRNVVIYFDEDTQRQLWGRFRQQLHPGGRLYVGHSERVTDDAFKSDGLTSYRLEGGRS
jgi:chemotaxis protein methyltransferase CheR